MFIIARTNSSSCTWQSNLDFLCQAFAALQLNIKSGWVFIVANIQKGLWQSLNHHETRRRFSWIHSPLIASLSCIYRKGKRRESLKIFDSSNGLFPLYNPPRDKISIIFFLFLRDHSNTKELRCYSDSFVLSAQRYVIYSLFEFLRYFCSLSLVAAPLAF